MIDTKIIECNICYGHHHAMRAHCPFCGARRVFLATSGYQPQHTSIVHRQSLKLDTEIVRAFRSDLEIRRFVEV